MVASRSSCPSLAMAHVLGRRWAIPIIEEIRLSRGGTHFNEMRRSLRTITAKSLNHSLEELCSASLVSKTQTSSNGTQSVSYRLTRKGKAVGRFIEEIKGLGTCLYGIDEGCKSRKCGSCPMFTGNAK